MARTVDFYVTRASQAFEAGFTSKAAQKAATDDLNRAHELLAGGIRELVLAVEREARTVAQNDLYWGLPDLHNWKPKHSAAAVAVFPQAAETVAQIEQLVELRSAIKEAPVVKAERKTDERAERIQGAIRSMMVLRREQYARGLELHDLFGGLPVYANVHVVTNQHGTTFLRTFYYMWDKLTPLNVILAVMQTKADEQKA